LAVVGPTDRIDSALGPVSLARSVAPEKLRGPVVVPSESATAMGQ
jgi:hypothetical protein